MRLTTLRGEGEGKRGEEEEGCVFQGGKKDRKKINKVQV